MLMMLTAILFFIKQKKDSHQKETELSIGQQAEYIQHHVVAPYQGVSSI